MRRRIYDDFFLLLLAFGVYGVIRLLSPFAGALMGALICVVTFYPMHESLQRRFPRPGLHAAISEILVVLFFVIPIALLAWVAFAESAALLDLLNQTSSVFTRWRDGDVVFFTSLGDTRFLRQIGLSSAQMKSQAILALNHTLNYITASGTHVVGHVVLFALNIFVMLFALFFFFRDGDRFLHYLQSLIPLRQEHKEHLGARMRDTIVAVVRGGLLTSLIQALLALVGYLIVGTGKSILLGALTIVMGLVPVVGTFSVWGALGAFYLFHASYGKGVFILLWGTIVVTVLVDVFIRPYLVGKRAQVPLFALFFALLGGMEVWGVKGLVLGPIIVALMPELVTIYRMRYLRHDMLGERASAK